MTSEDGLCFDDLNWALLSSHQKVLYGTFATKCYTTCYTKDGVAPPLPGPRLIDLN